MPCLPAMTGNVFLPPIEMVMTEGWLVVLIPTQDEYNPVIYQLGPMHKGSLVWEQSCGTKTTYSPKKIMGCSLLFIFLKIWFGGFRFVIGPHFILHFERWDLTKASIWSIWTSIFRAGNHPELVARFQVESGLRLSGDWTPIVGRVEGRVETGDGMIKNRIRRRS